MLSPKLFEVKANVTVTEEAFGRRKTPWRSKRQFRRARGRLRGERRAWARNLRYHPNLAISREAHMGAMIERYVLPRIVEAEDRYILREMELAYLNTLPSTVATTARIRELLEEKCNENASANGG